MNWEKELYGEDKQPLEHLVDGYSYTSIFRRIAFIGDSLSSGEFETRDEAGTPGYHDLYEHSWGQYIARKNGLTAYNFSRGGMTASEYMQNFAEQQGFWAKEKACQAYVIALGVNDIYNRNDDLGSLSDICKQDWKQNKPTFLGYYAAIIQRYQEIQPDAKFFLVTVPNGQGLENRNPREEELAQAIRSLAGAFPNCYVIDLHRYGPAYDRKFCDTFFMYGHMNPMGYVLTARLVDSYIDFIIRHHPKDFETVGFIGTDILY